MVLSDILNNELCINTSVIVVNCSDGKSLYNGEIIFSDLPKQSFDVFFEGTPHIHSWETNRLISEHANSHVIALFVEKNCLFVGVQY